ncbi:siderophore-interacting protein [Rhodopirellula sp. JC740]|uniref:Siderophore-interacting protein n=1 Tax=Rhodopirellula halodulae TaxID=2894198 RepID=A0ABS8NI31_9BACT|nr:siderophore-interacting protein [Rhodopirellula sp. JC740]MCC9643210.1 siderophore-interacting protein [Rhodopirellula sp. JC740]
MAKRPVRELEVIRSVPLSKHMLRITLGGDAMAEFPADQESAYVKLVFPQEDDQRPLMRSYTVRKQRPGEIDLDVVLHDPSGPACTWARSASVGDRVMVGGPGPKKLIEPDADWFLLAGDLSALPAISVNLEQLPSAAVGHAVIEVPSEDAILDIDHPDGVQLHWEVNQELEADREFLASKVRALDWCEGRVSVWAACEFNSMRILRRYLCDEKSVPASNLYLSSYWKLGQSDEGHKEAKRLDNEQRS